MDEAALRRIYTSGSHGRRGEPRIDPSVNILMPVMGFMAWKRPPAVFAASPILGRPSERFNQLRPMSHMNVIGIFPEGGLKGGRQAASLRAQGSSV